MYIYNVYRMVKSYPCMDDPLIKTFITTQFKVSEFVRELNLTNLNEHYYYIRESEYIR